MSELEEVAREELMFLWTDLKQAQNDAWPPGAWSIQCDYLAGRIKKLTILLGPTPWEQVPNQLLLDDTYQRLHREVGVVAEVDMERVHYWHEWWEAERREMRERYKLDNG